MHTKYKIVIIMIWGEGDPGVSCDYGPAFTRKGFPRRSEGEIKSNDTDPDPKNSGAR